jgi:hypothetical protein
MYVPIELMHMVHVLILGNATFETISQEHWYTILNPSIVLTVFIHFDCVLLYWIWVFDIELKVVLVLYENDRGVQ